MNFDPTTMKPMPGLAESWEFSGPEKRTFTMTLRHGVTFQDGTPLDAEAVKASLMHFKEMKRLNDLDVVDAIDVIAPDKIALQMRQEYSVIPAVLADRSGMIVSPAALQKYGKDFPRNPVGAGPFMLKNWSPGSRSSSFAIPGIGTPRASSLRALPTSCSSIRRRRFRRFCRGRWTMNGASIRRTCRCCAPIRACAWRWSRARSISISRCATMCRRRDNEKVREAMNMSVDRKVLADAVLGLGNSGGNALMLVPPASFAYTKNLENSVRYDPARAKQLLAEAGFPNGVTIKICGSTFTGQGADMTDIETEQMKAAGIKLDVTIMSGTACLQRSTRPRISMPGRAVSPGARIRS